MNEQLLNHQPGQAAQLFGHGLAAQDEIRRQLPFVAQDGQDPIGRTWPAV
jgi:hypothetical protein